MAGQAKRDETTRNEECETDNEDKKKKRQKNVEAGIQEDSKGSQQLTRRETDLPLQQFTLKKPSGEEGGATQRTGRYTTRELIN